MDAIVGEHGVDRERHGLDQGLQEGRGGDADCFFRSWAKANMRFIDDDEEMQLALLGSHLGDVDMKEADRVRLELFLRRLVAFDLWQPAVPWR